MKKVISLGEIMLRLSPANDLRFLQTECLDAVFGGSEANVAVALSQLGQPAAFVTKLPDNVVGEMALQVLRRYGVDTSTVIRGGKRLGIYFLEKGFSSCSSICTYDRAHSAIAEAKPEEFDWKRMVSFQRNYTGIERRSRGNLPTGLPDGSGAGYRSQL